MRNRSARKANELRRQIAAAKQTPLHMRGFHMHPGHHQPVAGQLDRAEMNATAKLKRYPTAPKYKDAF